jgi:ABC-2 type transport system permease protein
MNQPERWRRTKNDLARAWAIARKDIRIYYFKPPVVMFGIMMPVFLFLAFMVRRDVDAEELIPGLLAMTIFFGSSSVTSAVIPWERAQQTFERLLVAPISLSAILWGKAVAGIVFGILLSLVPLAIAVLAFGMSISNVPLLVLAFVLSGCAFASLGVLFASLPSQTVGDIMVMGNMVRLPLIFVSGVFIPLGDMPDWGRIIAFLSPLTYCNDLMNESIAGSSYLIAPVDVLSLLAFWVIFLFGGTRLHALGRRA